MPFPHTNVPPHMPVFNARTGAGGDSHPDIERVLFSREALYERVNDMAFKISGDYAALGATEITVIAVANGAMVFAADLLRGISLNTRFDTVRASSYYDGTSPVSVPRIHNAGRLELGGRHVLLVDDILDTGNTLALLRDMLEVHRPATLRTCVLLDKKARRVTPYTAEYVGFDVPDVFVVGYGLDFAERYRNLPFIGTLKPERQDISSWD
ncbi:MAG: hypoxanthine phosphoribosyltransferase [Puniceicoccales bacterium]|nr:hypoxanthine phosphoribosyltransferase [Puniceicoccales bacterium]